MMIDKISRVIDIDPDRTSTLNADPRARCILHCLHNKKKKRTEPGLPVLTGLKGALLRHLQRQGRRKHLVSIAPVKNRLICDVVLRVLTFHDGSLPLIRRCSGDGIP
jgi:hypothetical protein